MTRSEKLTIIAENQQKVFDAGYAKGKADGVDGYYDRFWDFFQNNGKPCSYYWAFSMNRFNDETYRPKYDIRAVYNQGTAGQSIFYGATSITDTKVAIFIEKSFTTAFHGATSLKTIRRIDCTEAVTFSNTFYKCGALENVTFTGVIGQNIDFSYSPLTKESILSVYDALSATATDKTVTFNKAAVNAVFTAEEWKALTDAKDNWTYILYEE